MTSCRKYCSSFGWVEIRLTSLKPILPLLCFFAAELPALSLISPPVAFASPDLPFIPNWVGRPRPVTSEDRTEPTRMNMISGKSLLHAMQKADNSMNNQVYITQTQYGKSSSQYFYLQYAACIVRLRDARL